MELYHLRSRMKLIQSVQLKTCPSVFCLVDSKALRKSRKKLDEYFPGIESLRHHVAHSGEIESDRSEFSPEKLPYLSGLREPNIYSAMHNGKVHRLAITDASAAQIAEVVEEYLKAFQLAANTLEKEGHLE